MIAFKTILALLAIACAISPPFLSRHSVLVTASGNVIHVWPGPSQAIQMAINNASSGDTVFVHNGMYFEHIFVNKSISLVGEDEELTLIDGNGTGNVVTISLTSNVRVEQFTIVHSGRLQFDRGIYIDHASGVSINRNIVMNNSVGIYFYSSSNNVVSNNTIRSNTNDGIYLLSSSYNVVSSNSITSNSYGIESYNCIGNVVSNNTLSNKYGLLLLSSSYNTVTANTIANNSFGVQFFYTSLNNTFYHNNFIGNTEHLFFNQTVYGNSWDDGLEGNYWDNYTGTDSDSDGIGDTPFPLTTHDVDNHPLMGMFSEFGISLQGQAYTVAVISNSTIRNFKFQIGTETGNRIITFSVADANGTAGFCRVRIPSALMKYPYIVLVGGQEVVPTLLPLSNATYSFLYLTYANRNQDVAIIYSETAQLYNDLLAKYLELQTNLAALNSTYYTLLNNYTSLMDAYGQLQTSLNGLNASYQNLLGLNSTYTSLLGLNVTYHSLLTNYTDLLFFYNQLQSSFSLLTSSFDGLNSSYQSLLGLNASYYTLLTSYGFLLGNYSQLLTNFTSLQNAYQAHLQAYSDQSQNIRNLVYILAATVAVFIVVTVYLSKRAHSNSTRKISVTAEE